MARKSVVYTAIEQFERLGDLDKINPVRSVAQFGRALPSGGRGRRFKSGHSDQR